MLESMRQLYEEIRLLKEYTDIETDELEKTADAIEHEVEERYIERPTDKNGEPVCLGDVLQGERSGGWCEPFEVYRLRIGPDGWYALEKCGLVHIVKACRHKPPTVEEVLESALNEAAMLDRDRGYWPSAADITNIVNEIAPKLQLREVE